MKPTLRLALAVAVAMQTLVMIPAGAQAHIAVGVSGRHSANSEYDEAGRRLVRESGWLPGIQLNATYGFNATSWFVGGEVYDGAIDYQGQTQAGRATDSRTSTGLAILRFGGAYALPRDLAAFASVEIEKWKRNIIGVQGSSGLQEDYVTKRLVAGVQKTWHPAATGAVSVDAAVAISGPERLRVRFSGLLDAASLETTRSQGIRVGASVRPSLARNLELRCRVDWIRHARSADVPATRDGQFVGTIAEPEHVKQAVTMTVFYLF